MARFIFSMQNLLDMKEKLEEQAKNNYSQANMRLMEAEEELRRLRDRVAEAQELLRLEIESSLDVRSIRRRENAIEILRMYVRQQEFVVLQRQKDVEAARELLNEAMKERKTYEKLRERAFEEFKLEENRKEQKEIDELVSYRFGAVIKEA
ncbi:MAG: flagellar export protein FliJ [Eubacterium sp.]|jgi:flagellar export protein FliJ|nr:flagellar export protein FliJ [Eubacterium sp.]